MKESKKVFKGKFFDMVYEVVGEGWVDDDTYVVAFQDMKDSDGDVYHIEAEWHDDEKRVTFVRVYEHETMEGHLYSSLKRDIEGYILKQVGVIDYNSTISSSTLKVQIKIALPLDLKVGEFENWLKNLSVDVRPNSNENIKILESNIIKHYE